MSLGCAATRGYRGCRSLYGAAKGRRAWRGLRILGYHRISSAPGPLSVPPSTFARQLDVIRSSDAELVPLGRGLDLVAAGDDRRFIAVTFDDGYADFLDTAQAILRSFECHATIFVPTSIVDRLVDYYWFDDPPPPLSWEDLRSLRQGSLVDVQAHSRTHPWLPATSDDHARAEIFGSKADLETKLTMPCTTFSYPAGLAGTREYALVEEAGYRAALGTDPGVNLSTTNRFSLRRTLIFGDDDEALFTAKLAGRLDLPSIPYRLRQRRRRRQNHPRYRPASSAAA